MGFQDLAYAQKFRDVIREIVTVEVKSLRPPAQFATVDSFDRSTGTCNVIFPGDTDPVPVKMYSIQPSTGGGVNAGDVVRVEGRTPRRHVTEVVSGAPFFKGGQMMLTALQTTASSANMFIDSTTGLIQRVTSSRRYKKNIKELRVYADLIRALRPVTYEPKDSEDGKQYLGLIAEELTSHPVLDMLVSRNSSGEPDAVHYDRVAVILIAVVQELLERIEQLESRQ